MEKYLLRKVERFTLWEATDEVEIDIEKLRSCEPEYKGNTPSDLLKYLEENVWGNEDWANSETNMEVYGEQEAFLLTMMDQEMSIINDTRHKGATEWLEIGKYNESSNGKFDIVIDNSTKA
jgi:hypothetical protein